MLLHDIPREFQGINLSPVSKDELLEEVTNPGAYSVRLISSEVRPEGEFSSYVIGTHSSNGELVQISLRTVIADKTDPNIVFSIPGGAGVFSDRTLLWLATLFRKNHACIDWVSRGQSPVHSKVKCLYDPLFMQGDSYQESFMYHNTIGIWGTINWLFSKGYKPTALVGGSWGGVYSFLLSCLDNRIERIYSTFGCGGFCLPGVERRNLWDDAIGFIGPKKAAAWFGAFDPLLRIGDQRASVYLESATNDKFFSLDMISTTWRHVTKKNCFSLAHNQDHTMRPYGKQPYVLEYFDKEAIDYEAAKRVSLSMALTWEAGTTSILAWPTSNLNPNSFRLISSEQLSGVSDMSRNWQPTLATQVLDYCLQFEVSPSNDKTHIVYYLESKNKVAGQEIRLTTPLYRNAAFQRGLKIPTCPKIHTIYDSSISDVWEASIGDKTNPALSMVGGAVIAKFNKDRWSRVTIYGIKSWQLPVPWNRLILEIQSDSLHEAVENLTLFISRNFQRTDEMAMIQSFSRANLIQSEEGRTILTFTRSDMSYGLIRENRFQTLQLVKPSDITQQFDAVGIVDLDGKLSADISIFRITIE